MALRTVMIFPELSGMEAIDALRRRYDPLAALVRPHITLVFPFESDMSDGELADILAQAAEDVAPFALRLQGFSKETRERYLFLNVTKGAGPLGLLHDRLYAGRLAPFDAGRAYVPHMTVGHLPDARALHEAHAQASRYAGAFEATVTHVHAERIGENGESIVILEQALRGRKAKEKMDMEGQNLPVVHVINGRQKKLLQGHPWVYGNEIERVEGEVQDGGLVAVQDFRGRYMGTGFYNSRSLITVRLLTHRQEEITDALIASRVRAACGYRRFILRRPGTDSCRLIYGEADRLPGVICDRFGDVIVLQVLALGMERYTQVIADTLMACEKPGCLILQNDDAIRRKEGMECFTKVLSGSLPERVIIHENGVKLAVDVLGGQKTGYFLDQKDNHLFLRQFCAGARVLDCFSYIGAFALNAAAAGAGEVTAVDISEAAVALIRENAALNGAQVNAVCANCFDFLRAQVKEKQQYDVIVLDPPAFTKAHANMANACRGYKEIALSAMRLLPAGGVLATHSCSYHMPEDVFVNTVLSAAQDLHRQVRVITLRRQDIDHPVLAGYPESHYLKSLWLQMLD